MLALVFSCCGLRHRPRDPPDELSPLIPRTDDAPTPQPRVVDHQQLRERLGSVVRAKEGRMVNVNAHSPFNFHGQRHPEHSSSSSRNVSGGTLPSSRAASPSPPREPRKSPSIRSLRCDAHDVHYLPLVVASAAPVLSVRLVKSARSTHSLRGRSQRTPDPDTRPPVRDVQSDLDQGHTPRALPPSATSEQASHLPVNADTPHHHPEDFNIHDAGAVARSWGD